MDLTIPYYFDLQRTPYAFIFAQARTVLDMKRCVESYFCENPRRELHDVVSPDAFIEGDVIIEDGAVIEAGAMLQGPVWIGAGTLIRHGALVRDHAIIGPGCKIGHSSEVTRSVIMAGSFATHFAFIRDSIVGSGVNIGSSCVFANLVLDHPVTEPATKNVFVCLHGKKIDSTYTKFGAVIGDNSRTASHVSIGPGTLIGKHVVLHTKDK